MDQLAVRTEYSFGRAFGRIPSVISALKAAGATMAAITDFNTYGHIEFYREATSAGMLPVLGVQVTVDEHPFNLYATSSDSLSQLYAWTSLASRQGCLEQSDILDTGPDILKLSYTHPDYKFLKKAKAYLAISPGHMLVNNKHRESKLPLIPVSDNAMPKMSDKQYAQLVGVSMKVTPQHILTLNEHIRACGPVDLKHLAVFKKRCAGLMLPKADNIHDPLDIEAECRKNLRGIKWTQQYEDRLQLELKTIREKGFIDYFSMISGMVKYAKARMLVGPARGSAAGSLVCYLLDITDIDPIVHDLLFERFIDETRMDFPDIDLDFPDSKREIVFEYLRNRYGSSNVARIGTVNRFKAKSALSEVAKKLNIPPWEIQETKSAMIERSGGDSRAQMCFIDTIKELEVGQKMVAKFPGLLAAAELEEHAKYSGVHAAGALVCNNAVSNYCTVDKNGVAQLDKIDAERINLMKVDILGLRTLSVIEATKIDVRNIPLTDQKAFDIFNKRRFCGIFQFEGQALQSLTRQMGVKCFEDIVSITSLGRPGPLNSGGARLFINRHTGQESIEPINDIFDDITAVTNGIVLYQEQVMKILRQMGGMPWADVQILRRAMSKSLGVEFFEKFYERFAAGAAKNDLDPIETRKAWDLMIHFGSYGFNRSHAVAYSIISYWCAWLKAHHPVEFACATLAHAKDAEQSIRLLREIVNEGLIEYVPFDPALSGATWSIQNGKLYGALTNVRGIGDKIARQIVEERDSGTLSERHKKLLTEPQLEYAELFPTQSRFGHIYADPEKYVQDGSISHCADLSGEQNGSFVLIGHLLEKDLRDMNETSFLAKRNGKKMTGQTKYLNLKFEDDTDVMPAIISRFSFASIGQEVLNAPLDSWWLIRGDVRAPYRKMFIKKMKRLA
jgi:DNA polymerase III alpha subunit